MKSPGPTYLFVTLRGEPYLLWRAVDEHGAELDILLQKRRDKAPTKRFFKHVLRSSRMPRKIVTDQLGRKGRNSRVGEREACVR